MKDTPDRSDHTLPARRSPLPPPAPTPEAFDEYADPAHPSAGGKRVSIRLILRALKRHWLFALMFWTAGSAGLAALAFYKIQPTYDAMSQVRVELNDLKIFAEAQGQVDVNQYMQNQVARITSPTILSDALVRHPELKSYPLLRDSKDPEADLRAALKVGIVPRTSFIQVEMSSPVPTEAAEMVNAVVEAYLDKARATYDESTQIRIKQLKGLQAEHQAEYEKQRRVLEKLNADIGAANEKAVKDRNSVTVETYRRLSEELTEVKIKRFTAQNELDQLRNEKTLPARPLDDKAVGDALVDLFYAHPKVAQIEADLKRASAKLKDAQRRSRNPSDPSVVMATERVKELNDEKDDLWRTLEPGLRRQLVTTPADDAVAKETQQAEKKLASLVALEEVLTTNLDQTRLQNKTAEAEVLKIEFARRDLQRAQDFLDKITSTLNQLEFDAHNPIARANLEFPARPTNRPNADRRTQLMAAAPILMGALLTGLLVLVELRGARVADPEELTNRVKLQVIGVVPPLPQVRSAGPVNGGPPSLQNDARAQRQLDEFVQSLDHLRVALCARPDPWGRDRHCVLITSACGSEGKTTLAAQLAERCVNAGLMTLLIDCDLRNPTLSRMLDAETNPGLINVLRGELAAEDVVMVIGDAGGFHLLPAGSPRVDPSRLLQNERLGKLLAQARESFDMIIVDAPPVLPVPDALTIGRWTDGAVLAVRYDTSRFPLVERANRRLAHVGVPVIGAVVNGVRSESSYGGYYGYGYGSYGGYGSVPAAPVADD
jgi:capsular exopolysaccharide synthesis family protein